MITITNLSKKFSNKQVLKDLCLDINDGEITALVGKNGVGKSTLIRLIAGILEKDSGKIKFGDNQKIGILLGGDINLYRQLTAYEIIDFFGKLNGQTTNDINSKINELDKVLNIKSFINEKAYTFSRGMRQKIGLAISIVQNPDILLLDEPSTGLDIEACNDVIKFIKYLKQQNKTILIATHNIFEISDLSDNIAFMANGKISEKTKTEKFFRNCDNEKKCELIIEEINRHDY